MSNLPCRIVVVGITGSGKTTFARQLSKCLKIPHIELDAIFWGPNWKPLQIHEFRLQTSKALINDTWVVDGNYSNVRDITWGKADTLIWLDYSLSRILIQLMFRTTYRILSRENLWNDNQEDFFTQFLSRDSLFLYAIKSSRKHKDLYPKLLSTTDYSHLTLIKFKSPNAANQWIKGL